MKRTFCIIGCMLTFLLPAAAAAQCPVHERTSELAGKTPIGHYAQQVIERVNDGIALAKNQPTGSNFFFNNQWYWLFVLNSMFFVLEDTELRAVQHSYNLTSMSACLHADLAIIEAKMEEVRCEVNSAFDSRSAAAINIYRQLLGFLNQSYQNILIGARNPEFEAVGWQDKYGFDAPFDGWCCMLSDITCRPANSQGCESEAMFYGTEDACLTQSTCSFSDGGAATAPEFEAICPFDSDYLHPNTSGYGCDQTVLDAFSPPPDTSIEAEREALEEILEKRDEFLDDIDHIKDAAEKMDDILDNRFFTSRERQHLQQFGTARVDTIEHKRVFGCEADKVPEDEVRPSRQWSAITPRGPFFFAKDHIGIWKAFFNLNHYWASKREYPSYLKHADEFVREADRADRMEKDEQSNRFITVPRNDMRSRWAKFMHGQATEEAGILPKAQDIQREVIAAMQPIRPQMRKNIELVKNKEGGLRTFIKKYAFFLRRSCVFRPCNAQLDQILKIVLSDECFPYTSGEFSTDDAGGGNQNTWERCRDAVNRL